MAPHSFGVGHEKREGSKRRPGCEDRLEVPLLSNRICILRVSFVFGDQALDFGVDDRRTLFPDFIRDCRPGYFERFIWYISIAGEPHFFERFIWRIGIAGDPRFVPLRPDVPALAGVQERGL